jgi:hypothetical protein
LSIVGNSPKRLVAEDGIEPPTRGFALVEYPARVRWTPEEAEGVTERLKAMRATRDYRPSRNLQNADSAHIKIFYELIRC